MRLSGRLILAALVLLAGSCSKTTEEEEPLPSMATVRALSDRVTLSPGGQAYAEFSVTPFETQFNYDAGSEDCDISVVGQSGEPIKEFQIVKIEPAGSSYEDHGKYKILLKDALTKFSYSQQCFIALKDDYGRISKSGGFIVSCEGDELTRTLLATGLPLIRIDTDGGVEPPLCQRRKRDDPEDKGQHKRLPSQKAFQDQASEKEGPFATGRRG